MKSHQEKRKFIEDYLIKYFDEMLLKDIRLIKEAHFNFTIPYVLLVCAGIDFLGGLKEGFQRGNSAKRSKNFIKEWMAKINILYGYDGVSEVIYSAARKGSSHQAIYKKEVASSSLVYPRDKHLHLISVNSHDRIFIHAQQLVDDFLYAQRLFRQEYINENNTEVIFDNLQTQIQENEIDEFPTLILRLKRDGLIFEADQAEPSAAPFPE